MKKITKTTKKEMPKAKKQAKKKAAKVVMARFEYRCPASTKKKLFAMAKKNGKTASAFLTSILKSI